MFPVTLLFEDGRAVQVEARDGETVHAAALRHKVRLETDCLEGACATCKAFCASGEFELGEYVEEALSPEERAAGYTLACQMRATGPCVLEFPYPSTRALARVPPVVRDARVVAVTPLAGRVVQLDLAVEGAFPYLAGQYVHLHVPGAGVTRSYSMAGRPGADAPLSFQVKLLEAGAMSDYVASRARPGDTVRLEGPFGHFYLRMPSRPILMVAGGTGLAPMLAMLDALVHAGAPTVPVILLRGAQSPDEVYGDPHLQALAARGLAVDVRTVVVAGDAGWRQPTGHVTDHLQAADAIDRDVYLCGPPAMIEAARTKLAGFGVPASRVRAERFVAS